jgi:hypothetical protein
MDKVVYEIELVGGPFDGQVIRCGSLNSIPQQFKFRIPNGKYGIGKDKLNCREHTYRIGPSPSTDMLVAIHCNVAIN